MKSHAFPHLFSSGTIGSLSVANRVIKAPTSTAMSNMDGSVSRRLLSHYRELARGGTGLLIVEYAYIDDIASKSAHCQLGISSDEHIPGLAWLASTIQQYGARAGIQIEHCGMQKFLGTPPIKSASPVAWPELFERIGSRAVPEELTVEEIREIVNRFSDAAVRAVDAGFDLIEVHGAHGYLITNFLSPHTNRRTDIYGGPLENRMRILRDTVLAIRNRIGPDFPLTVRLSGTDYEPGGIEIGETVEVCKMLQGIGVDALHISGGDHHQMEHQVSPMSVERGHNVWAAEAVKRQVDVPVIASGSITLPDFAESVLAGGRADFVALGRPLWADPQWTRKACEGRPEDIRPCIRCNEGCLERSFLKCRAVSCTVNPAVGREDDLVLAPARDRKSVAVIGGGPAGMEAARVCCLRGHDVTVYEKNALGGLLNDTGVPEFNLDIAFFRDYLITCIRKLGIRIVYEGADPDALAGGPYDAVVIATGAARNRTCVTGGKPGVFAVGDCIRRGRIHDAIHSAYVTALRI